MLRQFCKNLERYCLAVFSLAAALGVIIYIICIIRWGIIEPGGMGHSTMILVSLSGVGMGMIYAMLLFGFFGRQIRVLIRILDDLTYRVREWRYRILDGIHEWRVKRSKNGKVAENKLLDWLEDIDMKIYDVEKAKKSKAYSMQRMPFRG